LKRLFALVLVTSTALGSAQSLTLHAIRVSATIELQTGHYWIDVDPTFLLEVPGSAGLGYWGLGLPHLAVYGVPDEDAVLRMHSDSSLPLRLAKTKDAVVQHELLHTRQWSALGPGFLLVYGVSLGQALEPHSDFDLSAAWHPPDEMRQCPMLRLGTSSGFMPCWRF
jgi:hypothetical protein